MKKNLKDETKFCSNKFINLYSKIEHELSTKKGWPLITTNISELYNVPKISGYSNPTFHDVNYNETTKL